MAINDLSDNAEAKLNGMEGGVNQLDSAFEHLGATVKSTGDTIGSVLDKIIPDPQARDAAKLELLKAENQQTLSEVQSQLSAILAEENSTDVWTSRARPSFLYVMYFIMLLCVFGGIVGIWFPEKTAQAATNINALLKAIPSDLYNLFGLGYLGYTGARSFEKWKNVAK